MHDLDSHEEVYFDLSKRRHGGQEAGKPHLTRSTPLPRPQDVEVGEGLGRNQDSERANQCSEVQGDAMEESGVAVSCHCAESCKGKCHEQAWPFQHSTSIHQLPFRFTSTVPEADGDSSKRLLMKKDGLGTLPFP